MPSKDVGKFKVVITPIVADGILKELRDNLGNVYKTVDKDELARLRHIEELARAAIDAYDKTLESGAYFKINEVSWDTVEALENLKLALGGDDGQTDT